MDHHANLFVVSAPSGSGKSSLVNALMQADPQIAPCISHTTRPPRGREVNGREYFFVAQPEFDRMVAAGEFVESAQVHGHSYGTSQRAIHERMGSGADVLLEIDWQGALQIRRRFPAAVLIFVLPPSWQELQARLRRRGEDAAEAILLRLKNARLEFGQIQHFDYVIINQDFERALADLQAVVHAQRLRYDQQRHRHAAIFTALGAPADQATPDSCC